jgi:transposase
MYSPLPDDAAVQMIDTTIVRVHQHGACITGEQEAVHRTVTGGLTSKIRALVDTKGLEIRLAVTRGEAHDNRLAGKLLSRLRAASMLLADRGYDADWIRELAIKKGACVNIRPKCNRNRPHMLPSVSLPARNLVERFLNKIKQCRRVATHHEKARGQLPRIRSACGAPC